MKRAADLEERKGTVGGCQPRGAGRTVAAKTEVTRWHWESHLGGRWRCYSARGWPAGPSESPFL